jgi:hypothetical protein
MELSSTSILISLASSQHNLYDIYLLLCIQYKTPDDGHKTCPKHVEFYFENKFEKLAHLFGYIIRIYHDERFSECQNRVSFQFLNPLNAELNPICHLLVLLRDLTFMGPCIIRIF